MRMRAHNTRVRVDRHYRSRSHHGGCLSAVFPSLKPNQRAFWHTKSWGKGSESVNYGNTGGSNATIGLANGLNQCELAHSYYNIRTRTYAVIHMFTPIPKAIY